MASALRDHNPLVELSDRLVFREGRARQRFPIVELLLQGVTRMPHLPFCPSEDQYVARLGTATGEIRWRGEGSVLAFEIGLRDPTGLRAAPSDEDLDSLLLNLRHQIS